MFGVPSLQMYGINHNNNINNNQNQNQDTTNILINNKPSFVERFRDNVLNKPKHIYQYYHHHQQHQLNQPQQRLQLFNQDTMKWSSSSSSLNSQSLTTTGGAAAYNPNNNNNNTNDKKSIFYTETADTIENDKMPTADIELSELREKLRNTEENLEIQVKKCENLIVYFTNRIQSINDELENEKFGRKHQLTKVVKALIHFETKLKNDQNVIRKELYEKDGEINRLYKEICFLKNKYDDQTQINVCEIAQYCPKCRKQFYVLNDHELNLVSKQSHHLISMVDTANDNKENQIDINTNNDNIKKNNTDDCDRGARIINRKNDNKMKYLSSSEDDGGMAGGIITSFAEARRSKKYTSKRTSGTYRDYQKMRSCDNSMLSLNDDSQNATETTKDAIDNRCQENENQIMVSLRRQNTKRTNSMNNETYSDYINYKHGLNRDYCNTITNQNSVEIMFYDDNDEEDNDDCGSNDIDNRPDDNNNNNNNNNLRDIIIVNNSNDNYINNNVINDDGKYMMNKNKLKNYNDYDEINFCSSNKSLQKNYNQEDLKQSGAKTQFESSDDWYASASDMDDSDGGLSTKPYGYNAVNPVLECVNQILLQNSMDGLMDATHTPTVSVTSTKLNNSQEQVLNNEHQNQPQTKNDSSTQTKQKRVHFSTQNSMVQVPRSISSNEQQSPSSSSSPSSPALSIFQSPFESHQSIAQHTQFDKEPPHQQQQHSNYESVYSNNDYEKIGSENNSSSNLYVDMDPKIMEDIIARHNKSHDNNNNNNMNNNRQTKKNHSNHSAQKQNAEQLRKHHPVIITDKPKIPPALPPKPKNLMKLRHALKISSLLSSQMSVPPNAKNSSSNSNNKLTYPSVCTSKSVKQQLEKSHEEPHYCSISEVSDSVTTIETNTTATDGDLILKNVKIIVDVHKAIDADDDDDDDNDMIVNERNVNGDDNNQIIIEQNNDSCNDDINTENTDESFADIPKLPNVAAIISPKKENTINTFITQDNYIMKSPIKSAQNKPIVNILNELNKPKNVKSINSSNEVPSSIMQQRQQQSLKHHSSKQLLPLKSVLPIQKSILFSNNKNNGYINKAQLIENTEIHSVEDKMQIQAEFDWYNLDVEYCKVTQPPDVIREIDTAWNNKKKSNTNNTNNNNNNINTDEIIMTDGVDEYNLDEEYNKSSSSSLSSSSSSASSSTLTLPLSARITRPDIIYEKHKQNNTNKFIKTNKLRSTIGSNCDNITTTTTTTAVAGNQQNKYNLQPTLLSNLKVVDTNNDEDEDISISTTYKKFETFLDDTGLTTKPLPRKRKIYYSAPYV